MTIRVGTIGASFAKAAYLPALATIDDVELVAIASARMESAQSAAEQFDIPGVYDDWDIMLDRHELDLVCIATPTIYHAPMALKALNNGAHVLCEKPMAMNQDESANMLETAEKLNKVHIIGHELRFNPNRKKIKDLIESGYIGEVRHVNIVNISASWGDPASRPEGDWWSRADMGGGRLGANGSHQLDLLRFWLGDVGAISGQIATMVPHRIGKHSGNEWIATADDQSSFLAEMQNGALCNVFMSGAARHSMGNHTQIFGSEGTILLSNSDEKLLVAKAGEDYKDMSVIDLNAEFEGINPGIWNVSFVGLMQELTGAIREDRKLTQGATFADGHQTQIAMDAIRQSSTERRWIDLS
ncbi:MAG: Gfo/Idh/MocA family protein [Aggregatilineales bacterium]